MEGGLRFHDYPLNVVDYERAVLRNNVLFDYLVAGLFGYQEGGPRLRNVVLKDKALCRFVSDGIIWSPGVS